MRSADRAEMGAAARVQLRAVDLSQLAQSRRCFTFAHREWSNNSALGYDNVY